MAELQGRGVRISVASPHADLLAVVWPGVTAIYHPRTESAAQIQVVDSYIADLERRRGIRPRTVRIVAMVETPAGVSNARDIASSTDRVGGFGVGPTLELGLGVEPGVEGADCVTYARAECELHARARSLQPVDIREARD